MIDPCLKKMEHLHNIIQITHLGLVFYKRISVSLCHQLASIKIALKLSLIILTFGNGSNFCEEASANDLETVVLILYTTIYSPSLTITYFIIVYCFAIVTSFNG